MQKKVIEYVHGRISFFVCFFSSEKPSNNHKCQGDLHICSRLKILNTFSSQRSTALLEYYTVTAVLLESLTTLLKYLSGIAADPALIELHVMGIATIEVTGAAALVKMLKSPG